MAARRCGGGRRCYFADFKGARQWRCAQVGGWRANATTAVRDRASAPKECVLCRPVMAALRQSLQSPVKVARHDTAANRSCHTVAITPVLIGDSRCELRVQGTWSAAVTRCVVVQVVRWHEHNIFAGQQQCPHMATSSAIGGTSTRRAPCAA